LVRVLEVLHEGTEILTHAVFVGVLPRGRFRVLTCGFLRVLARVLARVFLRVLTRVLTCGFLRVLARVLTCGFLRFLARVRPCGSPPVPARVLSCGFLRVLARVLTCGFPRFSARLLHRVARTVSGLSDPPAGLLRGLSRAFSDFFGALT